MGEALAAVGAAASILQIVQFSSTLLTTTWRLYKKRGDVPGPEGSDSELEILAVNTRVMLSGLLSDSANQPLHQGLRLCVATCSGLVDDLLELVDSLKMDPNRNQLAQAVRKSLKRHKADAKLKSLSERIERMKRQISDHINIVILQQIRNDNISRTHQTTANHDLELIMEQLSTMAAARPWEGKHANGQDKFANFTASFEELRKASLDRERVYDVLHSLYFPQISERISDVPNAHQDTLGWIFGSSPKANLAQWLSGDENSIYWISGQAGSGKSTLMKFLVNSDATQAALCEWAKPYPIIMANHFFWSAGTRIQKSQEGLFRTLLFQILQRCPELTKKLCPGFWEDDAFGDQHDWTLPRLFETFTKLAELPNLPCRIAILVDGLDEYRGDYKEMIAILNQISQSPRIKVCVSSRPWVQFWNAWEGLQWKISLHDLTAEDIQNYVRDAFHEYKPSANHPSLDIPTREQVDFLATEICQRAQGVFLWVYLVTRSLLQGLENGDGMSFLMERLQSLPSDLEEYFKLMFDTIERIYWKRTARVFKCLAYQGTALPLLSYHFICLEEEDSEYAFKQEPLEDHEHIIAIIQARHRNIIAQCKDLVRVIESSEGYLLTKDTFGFLHRTVFDFLRTEKMSSWLEEKSGPDFDPPKSLSKTFLASLKTIDPSAPTADADDLLRGRDELVYPMIYYAKETENAGEEPHVDLLDELERVSNDSFIKISYFQADITIHDLFFRTGLYQYQQYMVQKSTMSQDKDQKGAYLGKALKGWLDIMPAGRGFSVSTRRELDLEAVRGLLKLKISPNAPWAGTTVWSRFLFSIQYGSHPPSVIEACRLLIANGADKFVQPPAREMRRSDKTGKRRPGLGKHFGALADGDGRGGLVEDASDTRGKAPALPMFVLSSHRSTQNAERYLEKVLTPSELRAIGPLQFTSLGIVPRDEKRKGAKRNGKQPGGADVLKRQVEEEPQ